MYFYLAGSLVNSLWQNRVLVRTVNNDDMDQEQVSPAASKLCSCSGSPDWVALLPNKAFAFFCNHCWPVYLVSFFNYPCNYLLNIFL